MPPSTARRRGSPPSTKHRLNIRQIIEAALDVLEAGRNEFSMRGIAATLNVDAMALYHYFPNKQALARIFHECRTGWVGRAVWAGHRAM